MNLGLNTQPVAATWSAKYASNPNGTGQVITRSGQFRKGEEQRVPVTIHVTNGISSNEGPAGIALCTMLLGTNTYYKIDGTLEVTAVDF